MLPLLVHFAAYNFILVDTNIFVFWLIVFYDSLYIKKVLNYFFENSLE